MGEGHCKTVLPLISVFDDFIFFEHIFDSIQFFFSYDNGKIQIFHFECSVYVSAHDPFVAGCCWLKDNISIIFFFF